MDILHIEDNICDAILVADLLEQAGFEGKIRVAKDGAVALHMIKEHIPDLVLLDLNIPKKDGREVLANIRGHKETAKLPVIVLSSSKAKKDIRACQDITISKYLVKPTSLDEFISIAEEINEFCDQMNK